MKQKIIQQLALNTKLLPASLSASILAGAEFSLDDVVMHLLTSAMDTESITAADPGATWTEKRSSRQSLILTFLAALATTNPGPAESSKAEDVA